MLHFLKRLLTIMAIWQIAAPGTAICQNGFNVILNIPNTLSLNFDDILYNHDHLIVSGNAYIDSLNLWGLFITELDTNGIVLWHNTLLDSSGQSHIVTNTPCRFIKKEDNSYVVPTYYFNTGKLGLFIVDSTGKKVQFQIYPKYELTIFPKDIIQMDNSFYILGTIQRENFKDDVFILKTDSLGQQLWIKFIGTPAYNETFGDVLNNHDGTFTISSSIFSDDYYDQPFGQGWRRPWVFTVDTSGQIINQWMGQTNDARTLGGGPMYRTDDGDWILVSYEHKEVLTSGQTDLNSNPTITKLDSNFNLIWKKYLGNFTGIYDLIIDLEYDNRSQTLVAAGERVVSYAPWLSELEGWILKLNLDGEILWSVSDTVISDPVNGVIHFLGGVEVAPTGSIYAAGYVTHNKPPQRDYGWIIKATPDGCIDTICTTLSIEEQIRHKTMPIPVYPNPTSDILYIDLSKIEGQTITVEFLTLDGQSHGVAILNTGLNKVIMQHVIGDQSGMLIYKIVADTRTIGLGKVLIQRYK